MRDDTMTTFTIGFGWKVFMVVGLLLFYALPVYLGCMPFIDNMAIAPTILWLLVSAALMLLFIYIQVFFVKYKVTIHEDELVISMPGKERRVSLASITGFRYVPRNGFRIYSTETRKKIMVMEHIGNIDGFAQWLAVNFKNYDQEDVIEEEQKFYQNLGNTNDRESILRIMTKVKFLCKVLNTVSILSLAWIFLYPVYYEIAVLLNAIIVLLAILTELIYYKYVDIDTNAVKPNVATALLLPCMGLGVRALLDYNLIYTSKVWIYSGVITMTLILLLLIRSTEGIKKKLKLLIFVPFFYAYSYGLVIQTNCLLDHAEPEQYSVTVIDKRVDTGKATEYYIKVEPWGPFSTDNEIMVGKDVYDTVEPNGTVETYLKPGRLGVRWFGL